jgi:SAM-dependent methyltransferase
METVERSGSRSPALDEAIEHLEIAMPAPGDELAQDEEWVVVRWEGEWRRIRLHDYGEVFAIPGLYEKWVYEVLQCASPEKIRELLTRALADAGVDPSTLSVLDLGAGNGYVAEELSGIGIERFVGVDIVPEAATAAERDRPGLYDAFAICDLTDPDEDARRTLARREFDCMTCVAALGFGDIPPEVFAAAYNRIRDGGWAAFTIKADFMENSDDSGFSGFIRRLMSEGLLDLVSHELYTHRVSTEGERLEYEAFVGRKRGDVPEGWF